MLKKILLLGVLMTLMLTVASASANGPVPDEDGWCWVEEGPLGFPVWMPCREEEPWDPYECGEIGDCNILVTVCQDGKDKVVPSYPGVFEDPYDNEWYPLGACPTSDCLEVSRWYETRTDVDGVDSYFVNYTYNGLCTESRNNHKKTGYMYPAPGGLWYNGEKDFEWRDGHKYSMALLPNSCGPWRVELRGQGGVGGSLNWNPPGCK